MGGTLRVVAFGDVSGTRPGGRLVTGVERVDKRHDVALEVGGDIGRQRVGDDGGARGARLRRQPAPSGVQKCAFRRFPTQNLVPATFTQNRKVSELPFQIDSRVGARHARLFRKKLAMPVKILKAAGANEELGVIELQGKREDVEEGEARPRVGTFSRDEGGRGEATIHTGKYRIHGERKGLKRPLAVLQKCAKRGSETTYRLVGVVREKTTFSERPDADRRGQK